MHSDGGPPDPLRDRIIGLGERSFRKSYYPELQRRLADLERFRALLDESSDAILMINVFDGRLTDVNGSVCRYLGMDRATLLKMTAYDLIDRAAVDRIVQLFTGNDKSMNITVDVKRADGRTIPFEFTIKIVSLNGVAHAVAVGRDITERKRAEEALRKLSRVVEESPSTVVITDIHGNIEYVNRKFTELTGYTFEEAKGKNPRILKSGHTTQEEYKRLWETILSGKEWRGEFLNKKKNGEFYWEWSIIFPIVDASGTITNLIAVKEDITERKRAEEALRESEAKLHSFVEQSFDGIIVTDEHMNVVEFNGRMQEITGHRREEFLGKPVWNYLFSVVIDRTPERYRFFKDAVMQMYATHCSELFNTYSARPIERADGEQRTIETLMYPILVGDRFMIGSVNRDITERRATEDRIKANLKEKEVMLKEIHHRVKNNLQIISSLLSIQSQYLTDPRDLELFRRSQDRVRSIALVHEQLYRTNDMAVIDFSQYVDSLARNLLVSYQGDAGNVRLNIDVAGVFLGIDTAIPCGLIVNELVSNALKHAFPGGRAGRITVRMRQGEGSYVLEISDDGAGFSHSPGVEKSQSMGLQLVALLTEQLDGTMSVDTSHGTKFTIVFKATAGTGNAADTPHHDAGNSQA